MADIFDDVGGGVAPAPAAPAAQPPKGDIFDDMQAISAPPQGGGFITDLVRSWRQAAGTIGQAFTRPSDAVFLDENGDEIRAPYDQLKAGYAAAGLPKEVARMEGGEGRYYEAANDVRKDAATDYPLAPDYEHSLTHTVTSGAVTALPTMAVAAIHPAAGAMLGAEYFGQSLRNEAIDAGRPEASEDMAAAGQALGFLSAIPFGSMVSGLRMGNPVIASAIKTMTTNVGKNELEPVIANTMAKSVTLAALKTAGTGGLVTGAQTLGSNLAASVTGVDPNRSAFQGVASSFASGGILGLFMGTIAGQRGFANEQKAWEQLTNAYASEIPGNPDVRTAVEAYGQERTPANLAKVIGTANRAFGTLTPEHQANVIDNLRIKLGIADAPSPAPAGASKNAQTAASAVDADAGGGATAAQGAPAVVPEPPIQRGAPTVVFGSKGAEIPAVYAFAPTAAIETSHAGEMMAPNPNYALTNTRDYSDPTERDKQLAVLQGFDPRRHVTDAPDASVGPSIVGTVIDENGHASLQRLGGNNRGYAIANLDPIARAELNNLQTAKAAQFGLAPNADPDAELVRHVGTFDFRQPGERDRAQAMVDTLNPSPGLVQGTAKRAQIDAASVPPDLLRAVPMDIAPKDAQDFVQALIGHGMVDRNLTASIAASPAQAQDYTQRLLVHAAFQQPAIAEARNDPRSSATTVRGMIDAATPALVQMRALPGGAPVADAVSRAFTTTLGYLGKNGATLPDALDVARRQTEIDPEHAVAQQIAGAMRGALVLDKSGKVRAAESTANLQELFQRIHGALAHYNPEPDIFGEQETVGQTVARALQPAPAMQAAAMPAEAWPSMLTPGFDQLMTDGSAKLGEVLRHDALFARRPALRDTPVQWVDTPGRVMRAVVKGGAIRLEVGRDMDATAPDQMAAALAGAAESMARPSPEALGMPPLKATPAEYTAEANKVWGNAHQGIDTPPAPVTMEKAIRAAYQKVVKRTGFPDANISDVLELTGFAPGGDPMARAKGMIVAMQREGKLNLYGGDWSLSGPRKRAWGIVHQGQPNLLMRFEPEQSGSGALGDPALGMAGSPLPAHRQLAMAATGQDAGVSIPKVLQSYQAIVEATGAKVPIRFGRFVQQALGIYKPHPGVARIGNAGNLATAAHEVAHALQHVTFGDYNSGVLNRTLPVAASAELRKLGIALYGPKQPANGYESEGWAEFWRHYLTEDDVSTVAPATLHYVTTDYLPKNPKVSVAIQQARQLTDGWRGQGALARARNQMVKSPGTFARLAQAVRSTFTIENWIEEFHPLKELADEAERLTGKRLTPASNPYEVASARRGAAGAATLQMVLHGMIDLHGNLANDSAGRPIGSLREIVQPLRGLEDEFAFYLWGRRALELAGRNMDGGLSAADAQHLVDTLGNAHPEMGPVADRLYGWQSAVLDYLAQANPAMQSSINNMKAVNQNYVPLQRVMEQVSPAARPAGSGAGSSLQRIKGSGRPVKAILDQVIANTQKIVAMAHKAQVLQTIVGVSRVPGMGHLVEEVPKDRVKESVSIDAIRAQLEAAGIDTSAMPPGDMLDYWTVAERPKGADPIIPVRDAGGNTHWFQVAPELYDVLNGMEPMRMGPIGEWLAGKWARGFRLATTGVRPTFQLMTLPARQIPMMLTQTMSSSNPARVLFNYLLGVRDAVSGGILKQHNEWYEIFNRLGLEGGQALGPDTQFTRRMTQSLFRGKVLHAVSTPIESFRALLSFMDRPPRIGEMRMTAERIGWAPGTPMTADQAIALANAGKRGAAVDYSAGGKLARYFNQFVPFFNPAIQHGRTMARTFQQRPWATLLRVLAYSVLPGLALWLKNRGEKWYQDLPWRERYIYNNFSPDGKNVIQIPRPQEWSIFPALAEGALDSWDRKDPKAMEEALKYSVDANTPGIMPVLARAAWEQGRNNVEFFNRPIVPRSQLDLPPGDQFAPYTSELAKALGRAFPEQVSPRRVDAGVRSILGGAGGDTLAASDTLVHALGLRPAQPTLQRESEAADLPILGRLFRHGGTETGNNQTLGDFWDKYLEFTARQQSKTNPLDAREQVYYLGTLKPAQAILKMTEASASAAPGLAQRQILYGAMADIARRALETAPK